MLLILLLVLLLVCGGFGFWSGGTGGPGYGPYFSWGPLGLILLVIIFLALTGHLGL